MEHKEFLEQKAKSLGRKFEKNREIGKVLLQQKTILSKKLDELMKSMSQTAAKLVAIQEMLKE